MTPFMTPPVDTMNTYISCVGCKHEQFHVDQTGAADARRQRQREQVGGPGHGVGGLPQGGVDLAGEVLGLHGSRSARQPDPAAAAMRGCGTLMR